MKRERESDAEDASAVETPVKAPPKKEPNQSKFWKNWKRIDNYVLKLKVSH